MSGIEVVGLLLGVFPLMISAMEHYEETAKVTATWWRIRKSHRKDLGRIRDCELMFQLTMRDLLLPLVVDGTISRTQFSSLLASAIDKGWNDAELHEALSDRLGDAKDRFLDILQEMDETMTSLAKKAMVDDAKFQAGLQRKQKASVSAEPSQQACGEVKLSANDHLLFEWKRLTYSLTGTRREDLIAEVERYNSTLSEYLKANDRVAQRSGSEASTSARRIRRKFRILLSFWTHASDIFRLVQEAWICPCAAKHCAQVWLQGHTADSMIQLNLLLRCSEHIPQPASAVPWVKQPIRIRLHKESTEPEERPARTVQFQDSIRASNSTLVSQGDGIGSAFVQLAAMSIGAGTVAMVRDQVTDLRGTTQIDLCAWAQEQSSVQGQQHKRCVSILCDKSDATKRFELHPQGPDLDGSDSRSLESLLRGDQASLLRVQRLSLAYILASSFLQLYPSSWFPSATFLSEIQVPVSPSDGSTRYMEPFTLAKFKEAALPVHRGAESTFVDFGILLLELCFSRAIESHPMWKAHVTDTSSPSYGLIREAIASKWSKDVQFEAGVDYATAVDWCLHKGSLSNPDWRVEFAQHVVDPLQRCHEAAIAASRPA